MAKVTIRGFLTSVAPVVEIGEKKTKKQVIVVKIPVRTDEFNQPYQGAREQMWEIVSLGDTTSKIVVDKNMEGLKVEVIVYVDSYFIVPDNTGLPKNQPEKTPFFSKEFKLGSITIL